MTSLDEVYVSTNWQTISKIGAFTINSADFEKDHGGQNIQGMFIKFTTSESGKECQMTYNKSVASIKKSFKYTIGNHLSFTDVELEIIVTILVILSICVFFIAISCYHLLRQRQNQLSKVSAATNEEAAGGNYFKIYSLQYKCNHGNKDTIIAIKCKCKQ